MRIPTFKNHHSSIPTILAPACDFKWKGHKIQLQRRFYFEDRTFMSDIDVIVDGQEVDVLEYCYGDDGCANDEESEIWIEHAYARHSFEAFVQNYEEEVDDEIGEILERVVNWHLQTVGA